MTEQLINYLFILFCFVETFNTHSETFEIKTELLVVLENIKFVYVEMYSKLILYGYIN